MHEREKERSGRTSSCRDLDPPLDYAQNTSSDETPTELSQVATELMKMEFIFQDESSEVLEPYYSECDVLPGHCISLVPCSPFPVPSISRDTTESC